MPVTQISRIQHRRGLRIDLPNPLNDAEFGWAEDSRELFIGNGPFHGGNTQVLTQHSPATLPPYTFVGPAIIEANTGFDPFGNTYERNANFPTVRSYQDKFDEFVSILDYGGVGDGVITSPTTVGGTDNAGAFFRATQDLYSDVAGVTTAPRKRMALHVPGGIYRITRSILLYPFSAIIGDGIDKTIIILDFDTVIAEGGAIQPDGPTPEIGNECVIRTADIDGNVGANISNDVDKFPQNIFVAGLSLVSNTPQTVGFGLKDIAKIESAQRIRFERVRFEGNWETGDNVNGGSRAVSVVSKGTGVVPTRLSFVECEYAGTAFGFNITEDDVSDVNIVSSRFDTNHRSIKLGFDNITIDPQGGGGDPELFRVAYTSFQNNDDLAFDVRTTGIGNISSFNIYNDTNLAIRFDAITDACVSIGDTFANNGASICTAGLLDGPRVENGSSENVVMNAQDPFQVPNGFCGSISIDGDLTVTGTIFSGGGFVSTASPSSFGPDVTPATHVVTTVPYTDGNVIITDYGLEIDGVYRNGTITIIHNGAPAVAADLNYQDSYTEYNGPPSNTVSVFAEANTGTSEIEIKVQVSGAPSPHSALSFNFTSRSMTV